MNILQQLIASFQMSFSMFWEVLWSLLLGFLLSAIVQAVVSHKTLAKTLGGDSLKNITFAALFGIASSSCSYAAVALSRALFQKGASFTAAMVFEIASTNLVIELGLILLVLMGWQFALAEWLGGIVMIVLIAFIFRFTLPKGLVSLANTQAKKGLSGKMEGHAAMDMSISGKKSFWQKLLSNDGFTAVSHFFIMDWTSIWFDILIGFLIAGLVTMFVPQTFLQAFFFANNPHMHFLMGPLIGPLLAIVTFVCSIGNVPLALVFWNAGMSFGGVISFIFADLIVLPILNIYRKYYGWKMMSYILITFYIAMVLAGYFVEIIFQLLHSIPNQTIVLSGTLPMWFYTTVLNGIFLVIAIILILRFFKTGGPDMLKMMEGAEHHHHH